MLRRHEDGYTRRGRLWLSYDVHALMRPRLTWICEGDYRTGETRSLDAGVQLSARWADPFLAIAVDLVDHPLEPLIAGTYWTLRELPGRIRHSRLLTRYRTYTAQEPRTPEQQG